MAKQVNLNLFLFWQKQSSLPELPKNLQTLSCFFLRQNGFSVSWPIDTSSPNRFARGKNIFSLQMKAFDQESRVYNFLIPRLQKLRLEKDLRPLSFPNYLYASAEDELILMENLKAKGFRVVEKKPERNSLRIALLQCCLPIRHIIFNTHWNTVLMTSSDITEYTINTVILNITITSTVV